MLNMSFTAYKNTRHSLLNLLWCPEINVVQALCIASFIYFTLCQTSRKKGKKEKKKKKEELHQSVWNRMSMWIKNKCMDQLPSHPRCQGAKTTDVGFPHQHSRGSEKYGLIGTLACGSLRLHYSSLWLLYGEEKACLLVGSGTWVLLFGPHGVSRGMPF